MKSHTALPVSRRAALTLLGAGLLSGAGRAHALMAGVPPDTPAARVDANTPNSPWTGVVAIVVAGSAYSGVVIGPQHVLTAAHVAAGVAPAALSVVLNRSATPVALAVSAVAVYPGAAFPYDDLAVLRLAQPLPGETAIYPVVDTARPTGSVLTLVGYGASGNGANGPSVAASSSVKRSGRNVLDLFTDRLDSSGRTSPFFLYDFDGPSGTGPLGGASLGNSIETAVAGGDSGSGAFIDEGGGPALYGLSTVALSFTTGSTATAVFGAGGGGLVLSNPAYLAWLRTQTGDTLLLQSQQQTADVPVAPAWALAALGTGLMLTLLRRRASR